MNNYLGGDPRNQADNGLHSAAWFVGHGLGVSPQTSIELVWENPPDLSSGDNAVLEGEAFPHNSQDFYTNSDISLDLS